MMVGERASSSAMADGNTGGSDEEYHQAGKSGTEAKDREYHQAGEFGTEAKG